MPAAKLALVNLIKSAFHSMAYEFDYQCCILILEEDILEKKTLVSSFPVFKLDDKDNEKITAEAILAQPTSLTSLPFGEKMFNQLGMAYTNSNLNPFRHNNFNSRWQNAALKLEVLDGSVEGGDLFCFPIFTVPRVFFLVPAQIGNYWGRTIFPQIQTSISETCGIILLNELLKELITDKFLSVSDELNLIDNFIKEITKLLLPSSIYVEEVKIYDGFTALEPISTQSLNLLNKVVKLDLPAHYYQWYSTINIIAYENPTLEPSRNALIKSFENIFNIYHQYWKLFQYTKNSVQVNLDKLVESMNKYQQSLAEVASFHVEQQKIYQEIKTTAYSFQSFEFSNENEFYKGTTDWIIRFKGELIQLKGDFSTGLHHIHRLLQAPGICFYPGELEPIRRGKNNEPVRYATTNNHEIVITHDPGKEALDEEGIKKQLQRLLRSEKGATIEEEVYHYGNILYWSHMLVNRASKKEYIDAYRMAKKEFDQKLEELIDVSDNTFHVKKVIESSRIIMAVPGYGGELKKLRERVKKSLDNAIQGVMHYEFQKFLKAHIVWRDGQYQYLEPQIPIHWRLYY